MNDINLLRDFYRPKKTIKIISAIVLVSVAVALFAYFGIAIPLKEKRELARMASNFLQVNSKYENLEKEYTELSQHMEELKKKFANISLLISERRWSEVFTRIEQAIPQGVVLDSLSYDGNAVVLQGRAANDVEIARFMVSLKKIGLFSRINLKRIDEYEDSQSFILNCSFEKPYE